MKIPTFIERLLDERIAAVEKLNANDKVLAEWLRKNGADLDDANGEIYNDIEGGLNCLNDPNGSADNIRNYILQRL